jgi:hypothetical protein
VSGVLHLRFTNPAERGRSARLELAAPGLRETLVLEPGGEELLALPISARGPYHLTITSPGAATVGGRADTALAEPPVFKPSA